MTFKAGDTLAGYADSSEGNFAHACQPANKMQGLLVLRRPRSQRCQPPSLGAPQACGLGVLPDHRLIPAPVLKPALLGWISWAVAGRKSGYGWRGWLPAGAQGG